MIKFRMREVKGEPVVIGLGLSEENVKRLKRNMPIYIRGKDILIDHDIVIFYGATEDEMKAELDKFITPESIFTLTI